MGRKRIAIRTITDERNKQVYTLCFTQFVDNLFKEKDWIIEEGLRIVRVVWMRDRITHLFC